MMNIVMDRVITIMIPYGIVYSDSQLVDKLNLNPRALNEWLVSSSDMCYITLNEDNKWILEWLNNLLYYNSKWHE